MKEERNRVYIRSCKMVYGQSERAYYLNYFINNFEKHWINNFEKHWINNFEKHWINNFG